ncbi:MAG: hypothetical protein R2704_02480 [Microthrixaceae bacterium]
MVVALLALARRLIQHEGVLAKPTGTEKMGEIATVQEGATCITVSSARSASSWSRWR